MPESTMISDSEMDQLNRLLNTDAGDPYLTRVYNRTRIVIPNGWWARGLGRHRSTR